MVGKRIDYSSVPTVPKLENETNQKKYVVNRHPKGNISISKPACALFVMGALLLAAVAATVTYFLVPNCDGHSLPESLTKTTEKSVVEKPVKDFVRLPRKVKPINYRLFIVPELQGNFTTRGNVTIRLKVAEKSESIRLNSLDLDVDELSTKITHLKTNKTVKISKQIYDETEQTYTIFLDDVLEENDEYDLFLKFGGILNDYMVGFYKSHYLGKNGETRWIASTQFSPTDARRAFPCFDEMSFKAKFQINIGRPSHMKTLSNMQINHTSSSPGESLIWDHYKETPIMSTYLVAFIVHDFEPYSINSKFTVWARKDHLSEGFFANEIGPSILNHFESYFDFTFPLPKLDVVALPDFGFSAMENFGLITFRESKLLYNYSSATTESERDVAVVLAHELAHQWIGNLVTPKWWDDLWIKEGFSTYFQYLGVDHVRKSWNIKDEFYQFQTSEAFKIDRFASARPIHFKVQNSNDIRQTFDQISYQKGAALVRMLADFLGEKTFKNGLRAIVKKYQYSNADNTDLWEVLTDQAQKDDSLKPNQTVEEIMKTWMIQPGYPVVTVVSKPSSNQLVLSQKRFLINGVDQSRQEKWFIPITYTTKNSTHVNPKIWMSPSEDTVTIDNVDQSGWHLLNLQQNGYYIVNYDEQNWRKLLDDVMTLSPGTRAQLVSDSMDLAKAGLLDYDIPLKMITTIGRNDEEINYVHLLTIFDKTNYLHNVLRTTPAYGKFEMFFLDILSKVFEVVDFDESENDNYLRKRIRSIVLKEACRKSDSKCTMSARMKYREWMISPKATFIPPNEREIIFCTAIREGGNPEWRKAYDTYFQTNSSLDKLILLRSLGCSSQHWILAKLLDLTIANDSLIRKQDGAEVFRSIAANFHGHNLAFDFLRNKWDEINKYYGVAFRSVSKMIESLSIFMNSEHQLKQLESFKNENHYNLQATNQAFDSTIEHVKANIQWMKINYKSVYDWLEEHFGHYVYRRK